MLEQLPFEKLLILDIETVPQYPNFNEVPEPFQKLWEQKTIYQRKDKELSPEEFYPSAGIWAEFGKIVCISVAKFTIGSGKYGLKVKSFSSHHEADLLCGFIKILDQQPPDTFLCAHNGKEFDFPYLSRRILINGLKLPTLCRIAGKKPWEVPHLDTMEMWKFGDYKNYTSLDLLAAVFNIPTPKDDIKGSDVCKVYWEENNLDRICTYCQKDVITTAQLLLRFKGLNLIEEENIDYL